ncbi:hypothetical protein D3C75_760480 [compost metagenome]
MCSISCSDRPIPTETSSFKKALILPCRSCISRSGSPGSSCCSKIPKRSPLRKTKPLPCASTVSLIILDRAKATSFRSRSSQRENCPSYSSVSATQTVTYFLSAIPAIRINSAVLLRLPSVNCSSSSSMVTLRFFCS